MGHRKNQAYHHGNLQEALLDAGLKEARKTGARNLGVTHLTSLVGVSPMAIYHHFSSGESLKSAISQRSREELARRMTAAVEAETDVKSRLLATGRAYIQFAIDEPGLFLVAFTDCEAPPRPDDPSSWEILQGAIKALCRDGLVKQSRVEGVASYCWSTVHGYASLAIGRDPLKPSASKESIDDLMERIWAGVVARF